MVCALLVVGSIAIFLGGVITGAVLMLLLEREPPRDPIPPICDDP